MKHAKILKVTTSNKEYNVITFRFRKGINCLICAPYEGCNGGGRFGTPTFKRHRWKNWKHNRKTQYKN